MNHEPINEYIFVKDDRGSLWRHTILPAIRTIGPGDIPRQSITLAYTQINKIGPYYVYQLLGVD